MAKTQDVRAVRPGAAPDDIGAGSWAAANAYGKVNLTLDITGPRPDGYHDLRSLVIGVNLADRLRVRARLADGVTLHCSEPALVNDDNLAVRAARTLGQRCGRDPCLSLDLAKGIPLGAGLGGGSSDAATTLRLCNRVLSTDLDRVALAGLGAQLGSDVPLFLYLPAAAITGRGEHVEPVALAWSGWVLLAFAGVAVSTAEVYGAWRPSDASNMAADSETAILQAREADELSAMLRNHLEPAVFRVAPRVARAHEELSRLGCSTVRVSGAGSALYQLFDEREAAQEVARRIEGCPFGIKTRVVAAPVGESPIVTEKQ